LLTGHLHEQYSGNVQPNYPKRVGSTIVSQAGTAISNRVRENPNSYNMIYIDFKNIDISVRVWNGINFIEKETSSYMNKGNAWMVNNKRTQCHQDSLRSR
jgi:hypothetical protein